MFTLGLDFGTNSVRALVVRCHDGKEFGVGVASYPSGAQGILLDPRDPHVARQHPGDYLSSMRRAALAALQAAEARPGFRRDRVAGIGVDTTASSPLPVDARNRPLALQPRWRKNLNAQCWLWKDHTSWREAEQITALAGNIRPHYLAACGGRYSSEWFWSKILHCLHVDRAVFDAAHSWVELCDWIPAVLGGLDDPAQIRRGVCAAGHKAMFAASWGGLPDKKFLRQLHPKLAALRDRLFDTAIDAASPAGQLSPAWAKTWGLRAGLPISMGFIDVHAGAVGCGVEPGTLVKVIGTSSCDCAVIPLRRQLPEIPGICGIVDGSILPGHWGLEAGQAAVGDIFRWWVETICGGDGQLHVELTREAAALPPGASGLVGLDWHNGNRNILGDPLLSGVLVGCTLHTTRAEIYRAWIEATAFGARAILERFRDYGVRIDRIVCAGGIAEKNPLLMQIYADVTGCTMLVTASPQACALGGAITAAVLAGAHRDFATAQRRMTRLSSRRYQPRRSAQKAYDSLYRAFRQLHEAFGEQTATGAGSAMKSLLAAAKRAKAR